MLKILMPVMLCLCCFTPLDAQEAPASTDPFGGSGALPMGADPFGGAPPRAIPDVKFVILLGPNVKPGEKPFLDPYEIARQRNFTNPVPIDAIAVDLQAPLPTKPGNSVQVRHPDSLPGSQVFESYEAGVRAKAIRFGLTDVVFTPTQNAARPTISVRIGLTTGQINPNDLPKYIAAARDLDHEHPTIELYNAAPLLNHGDMMGMGMDSGYGGMEGMMGGEDMGMGGYDLGSSVDIPLWAEAEGTVQEDGIVVSWSLTKGFAAAIGKQSGSGWISVKLTGRKMTPPIVSNSICAFYCDDTAYAFSATAGRWDTVKLALPTEPMPPITLDGQSAMIRTADDFHIFTASGQWSSRSKASEPEPVNTWYGTVLSPGMPTPLLPPSQQAPQVDPTLTDLTVDSSNLSITVLNALIEQNRQAIKTLEHETDFLATRFKTTRDEQERQKIRTALLKAVQRSFDLEKAQQMSEANLLAKKFSLINEQFRDREQNRESIIAQRMEKLISDNP